MKDGYLKIEEVATLIGVSTQTLNRWYKKKKENPSNSIFEKLPNYELKQNSSGKVRLWKEADIWKIIEFKSLIPRGRNGFMGSFNGKGSLRAYVED